MFCPIYAAFADDPVDDESLLKAAFIYNFAKFTRWPQGTWDEPGAVLTLCTAGTDALAASLGRLAGERVSGHPVRVENFNPGPGGNNCHVLYVAGSEHDRFARLIEKTRSHAVLTISQIRGFADAGGIIQLYRDKNRIRFKINLGVARAGRLNLSARLLDLAEMVDDGAAR